MEVGMGDLYYIGKRRQKGAGKRRRFFLSLFLPLLLITLACHYLLYPYIEAFVISETKTRLTSLCAETLTEVLSGEGYAYEDFVSLTYTSEGRVAAASVNTARLNLLRYKIAIEMLKKLKTRAITVKVPISNILGVILFSSLSGGITVRVETADSIEANFVSSFEECGINQTRHLISFEFALESYFLLPLKYSTIKNKCTVAAADTLIVGEVPDSFTDIDRLTDNVSEIDIDDAVDFGNVIY